MRDDRILALDVDQQVHDNAAATAH